MTHADTLRMIASLLAIVALILVLAWLARRTTWLRGGNAQTMKLIGTQSLGNTRATLALVQLEDTRLVLGVTATHVTLLHTLPGNDAAPAAGGTFHAMLQTRQEP